MTPKPIVSQNRLLTSILLGGLALASGPTASAESYLQPWNNHYTPHRTFTLSPTIGYYTSTANFNGTGQLTSPTELIRYTRFHTDLALSYGLNPYLTAFGHARWARIQVEHQSLAGDIFGLTDQTVGFTIHAKEWKSAALDFQIQADLPAYNNSTTATSSLFLGDGSIDITGGTFLSVPLTIGPTRTWLATGSVGFTKRTDGFSSAIPWSVAVKYIPKIEGFAFSAGAYGIMSLHDDQTTDILDSSIGTIGAGGSYMVNAINPSLIAARGQLGYQISDTIIFTTEASQTLWGQGAPAGLNITFGVQARWGERQSKNPEKQSPSDYGKSNQGFVNYAFEARVVKVNDRMNLIKIDKGSQDGVELNQEYDVFLVKQNGATGEAVARARVTSVKPTEAALTITEFFREVWIEEGFLVKRPLQ